MTIEGATNTEVFQAYVREVPPSLRPGDIIVMDNLGAHKNELTLALIEQAGAEVRFLPAYSPDLNSIEMMWSKVKALLRKHRPATIPPPSAPLLTPPLLTMLSVGLLTVDTALFKFFQLLRLNKLSR